MARPKVPTFTPEGKRALLTATVLQFNLLPATPRVGPTPPADLSRGNLAREWGFIGDVSVVRSYTKFNMITYEPFIAACQHDRRYACHCTCQCSQTWFKGGHVKLMSGSCRGSEISQVLKSGVPSNSITALSSKTCTWYSSFADNLSSDVN